VNDLLGQAEQISAGMEAVANGDVGAIGGMVADAAGLPLPPGFGGGDGGGEAAGAGAGDAGEGGEGAGEGGEEEQSYTQRVGLDAAVNGAIDRGIRGGAAALGEALGLGGGGGGSENHANVDGPAGDVGGLSETDRAKGPGHNTHKVDGSYSESVGSMRLAGVLLEVHDEIAGNLTEKVGVAKVTGAIGDITADIGGNKTLQTLGRLVFTPADESESAGGSVTTMVGGLVYDRVKGSYTISAGAPATFIGAFAKLEAKTAITLTCGASSLVIDGSGVSLTSPIVTIIAGKVSLTKAVAEN
jgi:type VI secretion system secreted protein VgrG